MQKFRVVVGSSIIQHFHCTHTIHVFATKTIKDPISKALGSDFFSNVRTIRYHKVPGHLALGF